MPYKYLSLILMVLLSVASSQDLSDTLECLRSYIGTFGSKMDSKLFSMFQKSYPNTLSTTVQHYNLSPHNESTYIITGDIEAMWLRDSTNQFLPYMKITQNCPKIQTLARGLLNTQASFIMIDPYTNAFKDYETPGVQRHSYLNDKTEILIFGIPVDLCRHREFSTKHIWERKFEIDSLASFLRLAYEYHKRYNTTDFINIGFIKALKRLMRTVEEQAKDLLYQKRLNSTFYTFYRIATELKQGKIKSSFKTGLVKTGFRPSDDPNDLPYNIPGNAMLSTYLGLVAKQILSKIPSNSVFRSEGSILRLKMESYAQSIEEAIFKYGVVRVNGKQILAYEVDGRGNARTFDDANLPSLLSLPYLQFVREDNEIYRNTRAHILSTANPYYYQNGKIRGIGSSHTAPNHIWPLALITQILTTQDEQEIKNCLQSLKAHSYDNLNHESFSVNQPTSITRRWFAWANSLFGEMIITLSQKHPNTLK